MDWQPDLFLDLRFACSLSPPIIEDGDLQLFPAWISVFTAEIICCSIYKWTCTVVTLFESDVVISLIANDMVSPSYLFVRDILYCALSYVILILSASGNLCHSFLVKSYDGWTSNFDPSLHHTIRASSLLRLWLLFLHGHLQIDLYHVRQICLLHHNLDIFCFDPEICRLTHRRECKLNLFY